MSETETLPTDLIEIFADEVTTFSNFQEWVNKATSRLCGFRREQIVICLDKLGNVCTIGEDFIYARDNNLFPIKVYRLIRTSEAKKSSEVKIS